MTLPKDLDPPAPVELDGLAAVDTGGEARTCACGVVVTDHGASQCANCGRFLVGNQAARVSGLYARIQPEGLERLADTLAAGVTADRGGEDELSTLERSYIAKLRGLDILISLMTVDVSRRGLLTPSGSVRGVFDKMLAALTVFDRYASRIGLGRKARRVNLIDQITAARAAAERQHAANEAPVADVSEVE